MLNCRSLLSCFSQHAPREGKRTSHACSSPDSNRETTGSKPAPYAILVEEHLVARAGVEPARPFGHGLLKAACLPVPSPSELVRMAGVEPARTEIRQSLNLLCLPISPHPHIWFSSCIKQVQCTPRGGTKHRAPGHSGTRTRTGLSPHRSLKPARLPCIPPYAHVEEGEGLEPSRDAQTPLRHFQCR